MESFDVMRARKLVELGFGRSDALDVCSEIEILALASEAEANTRGEGGTCSSLPHPQALLDTVRSECAFAAGVRPRNETQYAHICAVALNHKLRSLRRLHCPCPPQQHGGAETRQWTIFEVAKFISEVPPSETSQVSTQPSRPETDTGTAVGVELFYQLLASLRASKHTKALLHVIRQLPNHLRHIRPLALGSAPRTITVPDLPRCDTDTGREAPHTHDQGARASMARACILRFCKQLK